MAQKGTGVARDYRATAYCSWLGAVLFIASAACFMAGGFTQRNEMKAAIDGGGSRHERMSKYKELNTTTLQVMWAARRKSEGAYLAAEATGAMAWFSLMPSVDALSTMSGERSASKLLRSCFAAVAVITVADFTFQAGMVQMTDWMSTWTSISEPEPDGGFGAIQALEIAYLVSTSR